MSQEILKSFIDGGSRAWHMTYNQVVGRNDIGIVYQDSMVRQTPKSTEIFNGYLSSKQAPRNQAS
jgi:hypothetical protein